MRSASERCAIEKMATRGLPASVLRSEPISSGSPSSHVAKRRRGQQVVQPHGQAEAVLGREEGFEVHDPDAGDAGRLDPGDQARQIEVLSARPGGGQQRRDQDVLAALQRVGVDAQQRQQAGDRGGDPLAQDLLVFAHRGRRRRERAQDRDRQARGRAGRVDGEVGGVLEPADALPVLAPLRQALLPGLGLLLREVVGRESLARGVLLVDPGPEVRGREIGKGQQQVAEIALRIDQDRRHAVDRGLLDQRQAEAGLAAPGHADAHGVRHEVARVVQEQVVGALAGRQVVASAEVEDAELLEVLHGEKLSVVETSRLRDRGLDR